LVGYLLGYRLKKIRFIFLGFFIEFISNNKKTIKKDIVIFMAGPLSNFFISLVFFNRENEWEEWIWITNLFLCILNLLPVYPLDGEQILNKIFEICFGYRRGIIYSFYIGKLVLCVITFLYSMLIIKIKNISIFLFIIFLWYKMNEKEKQLLLAKNAYEVIEKTYF